MPDTLDGGCGCGAIRFRLSARPTDIGYCHCRLCQHMSGAPAMVFATTPLSAFQLTAGEDSIRRWKSTAYGERWSCATCGCPLAMRVDDEPTTIDIAVAAFDDPAQGPPTFHIWAESRIPWFDTADSLPRHAKKRSPA